MITEAEAIAARGELRRVASDAARFLGIDRRGMRPAALDIAERVGAHPWRLAALRREPRLDQIGKPVAERAGAGELHIAVRVDLARAAHQLGPDLGAGSRRGCLR